MDQTAGWAGRTAAEARGLKPCEGGTARGLVFREPPNPWPCVIIAAVWIGVVAVSKVSSAFLWRIQEFLSDGVPRQSLASNVEELGKEVESPAAVLVRRRTKDRFNDHEGFDFHLDLRLHHSLFIHYGPSCTPRNTMLERIYIAPSFNNIIIIIIIIKNSDHMINN